MPEPAPASTAPAGRFRRSGRWWQSVALGLALLVLFELNGREIGQIDTLPTTLLATTLAQGDGLDLKRFRPVLVNRAGEPEPFVAWWRGRLISRYPIAPALLAAPIAWAQLRLYERLFPGWEEKADWRTQAAVAKGVGKHAASLMAAFAAVLIYRLLIRVGLERVALPATLGAALGSDFWTIGSQSLWQHGPAALMLTCAMLALAPPAPSRWRLMLGGLCTALMVACRAIDLIFALAILAALLVTQPRRIGWFLPGPIVIGGLLLAYNLVCFQAVSGGQAYLETLHPELHGVAGPWAGDLLDGLAGTLLSPARGLFVYSPWVALAVLLAPWTVGRLRAFPVLFSLVLALVPMLVVLSKYAVWWGGHCFGPRYWTDATPIFAVLLALGLDWARQKSKGLLAVFAATILFAIAVQVVGAFLSPSSWNLHPKNVDRHHERLWDWRDTEITRCFEEQLGLKFTEH